MVTKTELWWMAFVVVLAIFMGLMTPVWMQIPWLLWIVAALGLPV